VNKAVVQIDDVTQQNAALVEQAAASAASLQEQASYLAQAIAVFELAAEGGRRWGQARNDGRAERRAHVSKRA
jgi:hypothetical protein